MKSTVTIVVPCFNGGPWLKQCLESALGQTYPPAQVIVVDDGSTDNSAEIAESFGDRITLVRQPNRGGNVARNAGLAQATSEYVQFLDADDMLLPEKLEHQVIAAEKQGAAAVYGDWRHRFSLAEEREYDGPVRTMGEQDDVLLSLLDGWWVSPAAIIVRRDVAKAIGGWDDQLKVAQDRDFFTRLAMHTDIIAYVSRCDAIYRRIGPITVATSNPEKFARGHLLVSEKIEAMLRRQDRFPREYRVAMAGEYVAIARQLARFDKTTAAQVFAHALTLSSAAAQKQSLLFRSLERTLGYEMTESIYDIFAKLRVQ